MPTIVTSKIGLAGGPTRQYTSIQSWEDACPSDLVAVDQIWKGEGYNDGELTLATGITVSGTTTDATHYLWLSSAPGHSFNDNPAKLTNRLAYVPANGVSHRATGPYTLLLSVQTPYTRVDGWQFQCSAANSFGVHLVIGATGAKIANCIVQSRDGQPLRMSNVSNTATNCLLINNSTVGRGVYIENSGGVYNCTVVRPSNFAASSEAIYSVYGAATIKNCAFFGFTSLTGTFSADGHNVTSSTVVPGTTGSLASKVYANQFVQSSTASGAEDFRVKAGSDLIGAGVRDATNTADLDIIGQARSTTAPTVGAWEYVVAGSGAPTGTLATTLANATLATSGAVTNVGSFQATLGGASMSASGQVATPPSGSLASTLAGATMAASGQITIAGVFGSSLAGCTLAAAGAVNNRGALASTLAGASMAASGTVAPNVSGTINTTLDGATMAAYGYNGVPPVLAGVFQRLPKNPRHVQKLP